MPLKLGRLPVKPEDERLKICWLHEYVELQPPKYPVDVSRGITDWGMDGNGPDPTVAPPYQDGVGDCGPASFAHEQRLGTGVFLSGEQVVALYFKYTDGQDVGVNLADFLSWLRKQGLIEGFAPLALHTVDAWLSTADKGAILGVNLTDQDMDAFNNGQPWSATTPDPNNGHAILKVGALENGDGTVVTWGQSQKITAGWANSCIEEAWALVTENDIGEAAYAALVADLDALPGATPATPPQPAPGPAPSPSPSPTPAPTPAQGATFLGESDEVVAKVHRLAVRKGMTGDNDGEYINWLLERILHLNPQASLSLAALLDDDPYSLEN